MSQSNSQVGVPHQSNFPGSLPYRPNQHIPQYSGREDYSQNNRRQAHPIQQQQIHHGPVPSNSPGVPSPSASPGARRTPPHDMSKQGVRQSGQPQMSVNHQPAVLVPQYRMQHQPGQMHHQMVNPSFMTPAAAQRPASMQSASAPPITQGTGGPRILQHGGGSAAHYGMQPQSFVPQHPMMQPTAMYPSRPSNQYGPAAAAYPYSYFQPAQSVPQSQAAYYTQPGQIPQTSYNTQVMAAQQPPPPQKERKRKILRIQDPNSGEDLTDSIMRDGGVGPAAISQVTSTGSTSIPLQHKEPESQEQQESRRIQAEFLTKVSRVASDPGAGDHSRFVEPESGVHPQIVLMQRDTSSPVVAPAEPARVSTPPATTEEPEADSPPPLPSAPVPAPSPPLPAPSPPLSAPPPPVSAPPPPVSAPPPPVSAPPPPVSAPPPPVSAPSPPVPAPSPPVPAPSPPVPASSPPVPASSAPVVVSVPEEQPPHVEDTVDIAPPTTEVTESVSPPDVPHVMPDAPEAEKPEPVKVTLPTTDVPVTKSNTDNKKRKKKIQDLEKKPVKDDMYEAFRSEDSEETVTVATNSGEPSVAAPIVVPIVVTAASVPSTEASLPEVEEEESKQEEEQVVEMEKVQEIEKSGAVEEVIVIKEEEAKVAADVPKTVAAEPEVEEPAPPPTAVKEPETAVKEPETAVKELETVVKEPETVVKELEADAPAAAPTAAVPKEEAKTNNVVVAEEPPAPKATKEKKKPATEDKVSKEEEKDAKKDVKDDNAKNKEGEPNPQDNKIGLKYSYRDDQWSPLNQEGKKQYDRSFLLQFQPDCTSKPTGLPDIPDIVLEKADVRPHFDGKNTTSKGPDNLFMPTYIKSPRMNQSAPSFPMGGGGKRQSKERKIISRPSASQEETLKRSDNAWKPDKKKESVEEKDDDAQLLKNFKSILNKLTPQNFQRLMNQTMQLPINSKERLEGVIDLVFEKAIMEPGFSQAYANMCRVMQNIEVKTADGGTVQFRKLILIKCQKQFERERNEEKTEKEKQRIATLSEKEKAQALDELQYQHTLYKRQIIGNIRFIGELFKLQLLTEKIMQGCIFLLLKAKDEESLECMSKLVSTVGQSLDHTKGKQLMEQYFHQVDKIIKEKKVSSRIRFMLQDLKDLRENNWKPRRNEAKPVMIDQIRKEAELDKQRREQEMLTARLAPRQQVKRRDPGSMEKFAQEDGWNTVQGNRSTKQNVIENPSKLKITRQTFDDNVQLGPGGRPGSLGGWGKGSSGGGGGGKSSSGSSESKFSQGNRFMMLGEEKQRSMLPPSGRDNKGRSSSASKRSREREPDRSRERQAAIGDAQRFTGLQKSRSIEIERNQEKRVVEPPAAAALSEDEYEKRARATVKEYVNVKDFKEAVTCVEELKSPKHHHILVRVAIEDVLEKSETQRESVGRLFHRLLESSIISVEQFNVGLQEILEFAEDMEIDIPMYWTYLGEIIGAMAAEGATNFAFLREAVQNIPSEGKPALCMAEIMKAGVKLTSEKHMVKIWQVSNFTWSLFLPKGSDVQTFVTDNKVSFTEKPVERVSQSTHKEETRIGNFQRELILLFQKDDLENDAVFDFIETSIPLELRKTKEFIRALVSAVCFGAVKGEGTNSRGDHELLKKRSLLMRKYIDGNAELELQALYAVQHLNYSLENPPGLLRLYFDVLYDEDVISEDTFYSWRDSDDSGQKSGKGIALKSVTSFYTWLEESDPPN